MGRWLPIILSVNAGYTDTAGFLALQGLFTAHVTGNFVTLGAALVFGKSGVIAKLIALPIFCAVVALTRLFDGLLAGDSSTHLRVFLGLKLALLTVGAILAVRLGPVPDGDAAGAILTGMMLVSAMALQNAIQRLHLSADPPTTIMTGNTTQVMIDLVDYLRDPSAAAAVRTRLSRMSRSIGSFALGCAGGAGFFALAGDWCFAVPPVLAFLALILRAEFPQAKKAG
jgi:uncharacterized membrane protein YoaK (UPF0700 family)